MSHLRLHSLDETSADALAPIPFPSASTHASHSAADFARNQSQNAQQLTSDIERSLDDVQRRLDDVKNQLDGAFHLPINDDWPPSAA